MNSRTLKALVPGILAAVALVLAVGVSAQTTPAPGPTAVAKTPHAAPMTGHHKETAADLKHDADMKAECEAMMAKKHEMQVKMQEMEAKLDKLVAEMNAVKDSKEKDVLEKPMAAVLTELVAQQKAHRAMMMEMEPEMMEHMKHHMHMHGEKGAMECPMMKSGHSPEPKADEKPPKT